MRQLTRLSVAPMKGTKGLSEAVRSLRGDVCLAKAQAIFRIRHFYGAETVPCPESDMARFISTYKDYPYTD